MQAFSKLGQRLGGANATHWAHWPMAIVIALCVALAVLQYKWTGEVSTAERDRLRQNLQESLQRLERDFERELQAEVAPVIASSNEIETNGVPAAFQDRFTRWKQSPERSEVVSRVGVAWRDAERLHLLIGTHGSAELSEVMWPPEWERVREAVLMQLTTEGPPPRQDSQQWEKADPLLLQIPRFANNRIRGGQPPEFVGQRPPPPAPDEERRGDFRGGGRTPMAFVLIELDRDVLAKSLMPELLSRHLGEAGKQQFDAILALSAEPSTILFQTESPVTSASAQPDGQIRMLHSPLDLASVRGNGFSRGRGPRGGGFPRGGEFRGRPPRGDDFRRGGFSPDFGDGRFTLSVRHRAGSLEAMVNRIRWRNLGISAALLALMAGTVFTLLRTARKSQELAQLQMNFVAGVSHELRTPLTVIRTAAYNLRAKVATTPAQVERYGGLIEQQADRLNGLVEQVLQFSAMQSGTIIRNPEEFRAVDWLQDGVQWAESTLPKSGWTLEASFREPLPILHGDRNALRLVLQNLIHNAVKYGVAQPHWIGLSAWPQEDKDGLALMVEVADHGPGIPSEELGRIFDPFFRGQRALQDQVQGTGLGLNLVKRTIEAHRGTITVSSSSDTGTTFRLRLPATEDHTAEFAK